MSTARFRDQRHSHIWPTAGADLQVKSFNNKNRPFSNGTKGKLRRRFHPAWFSFAFRARTLSPLNSRITE